MVKIPIEMTEQLLTPPLDTSTLFCSHLIGTLHACAERFFRFFFCQSPVTAFQRRRASAFSVRA